VALFTNKGPDLLELGGERLDLLLVRLLTLVGLQVHTATAFSTTSVWLPLAALCVCIGYHIHPLLYFKSGELVNQLRGKRHFHFRNLICFNFIA
jgi:hypothetical protein